VGHCFQGWVLSPHLWNWVVDDLIKRFERRAPKNKSLCGRHRHNYYGNQHSGRYVSGRKRWDSVSMRTRRTSFSLLRDTRYRNGPPKIGATRLTPKTQVKYLGTVLDCKLAWRPNVLERVKKATVALYASEKMLTSTRRCVRLCCIEP